MSQPIALVLDPEFGEGLLQLAREMPVWVVQSATNQRAVEQARQLLVPAPEITTVLVDQGDSPSEVCVRALYDIDEHHGSHNAGPEYSEVRVFGGTPEFVTVDVLRELGLELESRTATGFGLLREPQPA